MEEVKEFVGRVSEENIRFKDLGLDDFAPETYYEMLNSIYVLK